MSKLLKNTILYLSMALVVLLLSVTITAYAQSTTTGYAWVTPSSDPTRSYTMLGVASPVNDSATWTQILRIPTGAQTAVVQIRSGTEIPYGPASSTPYSSPVLLAGSLINYCTPVVCLFPTLSEARYYLNYFTDTLTGTVFPPTYAPYSTGNAAGVAFYDETPALTQFGNYRFDVRGMKALSVNFKPFSAASVSVANASGIYIQVRFQQ